MEREGHPVILGIESSCDDTSAAVICGPKVLSNVVANQALHAEFGGVVPEWASRAHLSKIHPVVDAALVKAGIELGEVDAVATPWAPGCKDLSTSARPTPKRWPGPLTSRRFRCIT